MSEGTVVPRRLLLVDPCAVCERLLPPLRSSGWRVASCSLESIAAEEFDVGLLCLHARHLQRPRWIGQRVARGRAEWIALLGAERPPTAAMKDFAGEWFLDSRQHPFDLASLQRSLAWAVDAARLRTLGNGGEDFAAGELLGQSRVVRDLRKRLGKLGTSDAPILIRGESGTGRTLVARDIHRHSHRVAGPFRVLDCGMPDTSALAAELASALVEAEGGSLLLAEIGDLPPALQDELFARFHGRGAKPDVRLLASTCVDLQPAVEQLDFNRRLFAWLGRRQLTIEPLRKRQGDIALLANECMARYSSESGRRGREFSEEALAAMRRHPWPGNVRELGNRVRRGWVAATGDQIEAGDLGLESAGAGGGLLGTLEEYKRRAEYQALCDALARYGNNLSLAARILGVSRPTFYRLLHKHQLL